MLRYLPVIVAVALLVYCFLDCAASRPDEVRTLPRPIWVAVIILLPALGPFLWLALGRPARRLADQPVTPSRPMAPDDDPDFLASLNREHRPRDGD